MVAAKPIFLSMYVEQYTLKPDYSTMSAEIDSTKSTKNDSSIKIYLSQTHTVTCQTKN